SRPRCPHAAPRPAATPAAPTPASRCRPSGSATPRPARPTHTPESNPGDSPGRRIPVHCSCPLLPDETLVKKTWAIVTATGIHFIPISPVLRGEGRGEGPLLNLKSQI